MTVSVSPIYAAIIAILMAVLSTRTAMLRGKHGVALGDGGIPEMALGVRHFGNLSEYAAMAVFMLFLMELRGISAQWLHLYGVILVVLRLAHPFILFTDMSAPVWKKGGRFIVGAGTAALLLVSALCLLLT